MELPFNDYYQTITAALDQLHRLMGFDPIRIQIFVDHEGIYKLSRLLKLSKGREDLDQFHYEFAFVVWLCTFNAESKEQIIHSGIIQRLCELLREARSEKRVRMTLQIIEELTENDTNDQSAVRREREIWRLIFATDTEKIIKELKQRKYHDIDIEPLIDKLIERISFARQEFLSWSYYRDELISGELRPSPIHEEKTFFEKNIQQFAALQGAAVERLIFIALDDPRFSDQVKLLALKDLSMIAAIEEGKKILNYLKAKTAMIQIMKKNQENKEICHQALIILQRIITIKWKEPENPTINSALIALKTRERSDTEDLAMLQMWDYHAADEVQKPLPL